MSKEDKIQEVIQHIVVTEEYLNMCNTFGGQYKEDLYQEFIISVMQYKKVDKLYDIYKRNELLYFCCTIIKNMAVSNTSPFYKKIRGFSDKSNEYEPNINTETVEEYDVDNEQKDLTDIIEGLDSRLTIINKWFNSKLKEDAYFFYHKELFDMYYLNNLTYRDIEKVTGIKHVSIFHSIKGTLALMSKELDIKPLVYN